MLKYCDARALIPTDSEVTLALFRCQHNRNRLISTKKEANTQSVSPVFKRRDIKPTSETEIWRAKLRIKYGNETLGASSQGSRVILGPSRGSDRLMKERRPRGRKEARDGTTALYRLLDR